jgi:hypothetical protein
LQAACTFLEGSSRTYLQWNRKLLQAVNEVLIEQRQHAVVDFSARLVLRGILIGPRLEGGAAGAKRGARILLLFVPILKAIRNRAAGRDVSEQRAFIRRCTAKSALTCSTGGPIIQIALRLLIIGDCAGRRRHGE